MKTKLVEIFIAIRCSGENLVHQFEYCTDCLSSYLHVQDENLQSIKLSLYNANWCNDSLNGRSVFMLNKVHFFNVYLI